MGQTDHHRQLPTPPPVPPEAETGPNRKAPIEQNAQAEAPTPNKQKWYERKSVIAASAAVSTLVAVFALNQFTGGDRDEHTTDATEPADPSEAEGSGEEGTMGRTPEEQERFTTPEGHNFPPPGESDDDTPEDNDTAEPATNETDFTAYDIDTTGLEVVHVGDDYIVEKGTDLLLNPSALPEFMRNKTEEVVEHLELLQARANSPERGDYSLSDRHPLTWHGNVRLGFYDREQDVALTAVLIDPVMPLVGDGVYLFANHSTTRAPISIRIGDYDAANDHVDWGASADVRFYSTIERPASGVIGLAELQSVNDNTEGTAYTDGYAECLSGDDQTRTATAVISALTPEANFNWAELGEYSGGYVLGVNDEIFDNQAEVNARAAAGEMCENLE